MPPMPPPYATSQLLEYLPEIFQQSSQQGQPPFLDQFLLAFERILLGRGETSESGLEEKLSSIQHYFDPGVRIQNGQETLLSSEESTPANFLPWLASWVALTLRQDWSEIEQRRFISRMVSLYRYRGTKRGLKEMLIAYTGLPRASVDVYELTKPLQVGKVSTIGVDTAIGGGPPHFFVVKMLLSIAGSTDPTERSRKEQTARFIIDQEKPAHTYYELIVEFPTIQVGVTSTIGKDTLIGTAPN